MKSSILKAAHKQAKQAKYFNGGDYVVYLAFYMKKENWNLSLIKKMNEKEEIFSLSIPFNSKSARKEAKDMGAKWNAESKTWSLTCLKSEINDSMYLEKYLTTSNKVEKSTLENYGVGCMTTRSKAMQYGYDAIER